MLKPKLQYFGHLMRRADSLEKPFMLGKTKGRRRRGNRLWDIVKDREAKMLWSVGLQRVGHN